jgi:hypothetical protein
MISFEISIGFYHHSKQTAIPRVIAPAISDYENSKTAMIFSSLYSF